MLKFFFVFKEEKILWRFIFVEVVEFLWVSDGYFCKVYFDNKIFDVEQGFNGKWQYLVELIIDICYIMVQIVKDLF